MHWLNILGISLALGMDAFAVAIAAGLAIERLTGWHASVVAILAAQGRIDPGATPVELAVPGRVMVEEARRRGFAIEERVI